MMTRSTCTPAGTATAGTPPPTRPTRRTGRGDTASSTGGNGASRFPTGAPPPSRPSIRRPDEEECRPGLALGVNHTNLHKTQVGYSEKDLRFFGEVEFDENNRMLSIEEKPARPKSSFSVLELYFYDNRVIEIAQQVKPSDQGWIEIASWNNNMYLEEGKRRPIVLTSNPLHCRSVVHCRLFCGEPSPVYFWLSTPEQKSNQ
jgi:hypothetical protein